MKQRYPIDLGAGETLTASFRLGTIDDDGVMTYWTDDMVDELIFRVRSSDNTLKRNYILEYGSGYWTLEIPAGETEQFSTSRAMYYVLDRVFDGRVQRQIEGPINVRPWGFSGGIR